MKWWYFHRREDGLIKLADPRKFVRPRNAVESKGNPYTPFYRTSEHADSNHVHILADDYDAAFKKAKSISLLIYELEKPKTT